MALNHSSSTQQLPYLTEKDLLRQIASNYTKEQITNKNKIDEVAAHDAKNIMKTNLQKCNSVWQSFTKFIRGQVIDKSRVVDTVLVGVFHRNAEGQMVYMPAPDFMMAGKFKLQTGQPFKLVGSDIDNP